MFIVADQAPVEHQDPVGLLDDPSFRLGHEAFVGGVAFDDVHGDSQAGAMGDDRVLESLAPARLRPSLVCGPAPSWRRPGRSFRREPRPRRGRFGCPARPGSGRLIASSARADAGAAGRGSSCRCRRRAIRRSGSTSRPWAAGHGEDGGDSPAQLDPQTGGDTTNPHDHITTSRMEAHVGTLRGSRAARTRLRPKMNSSAGSKPAATSTAADSLR